MAGITAITEADILSAPVRNIRSDPFRTPESAQMWICLWIARAGYPSPGLWRLLLTLQRASC